MGSVYKYAGMLSLTGIASLHLDYSLISSVGWIKGNMHVFSVANGDPDLPEDADEETTIHLTGCVNSKKSHKFILNELPF